MSARKLAEKEKLMYACIQSYMMLSKKSEQPWKVCCLLKSGRNNSYPEIKEVFKITR
jgi:hypothetical protein